MTMKTALISLLTAILLGFASYASGRAFDAADFTAILFATGLAAWTIDQYGREFRPLNRAKPIRLPIGRTAPAAADTRIAA